jgi:hypothetical protein
MCTGNSGISIIMSDSSGLCEGQKWTFKMMFQSTSWCNIYNLQTLQKGETHFFQNNLFL